MLFYIISCTEYIPFALVMLEGIFKVTSSITPLVTSKEMANSSSRLLDEIPDWRAKMLGIGNDLVTVNLGVLPNRHAQLTNSSRIASSPASTGYHHETSHGTKTRGKYPKDITDELWDNCILNLPGNQSSVGLTSWKPPCLDATSKPPSSRLRGEVRRNSHPRALSSLETVTWGFTSCRFVIGDGTLTVALVWIPFCKQKYFLVNLLVCSMLWLVVIPGVNLLSLLTLIKGHVDFNLSGLFRFS